MTPPPPEARRCLLVLGMHRSGTSALAGLLARAGAIPPATPMAPHASNPRGFFESVPVRDFNDALLARLHSGWNDLRALPEGWPRRPEVAGLLPQAAALIAAEFGAAGLCVLKDPRICRLLPFWRLALARAGLGVLAVHIHRHPEAVAASLAGRYGFAAPFTRTLWLRHLLDAEAASRDLPRCFTSYERLLAAPGPELARIAGRLGVTLTAQEGGEGRGFVSGDLCHHRGGDAAGLSDWTRRALDIFERWSGAQEEPSDRPGLDRLRAELDRAAAGRADDGPCA